MALKVTTFSSKGRATRIYSYKTNKIHHLQSDNQLRFFLILEWNNSVKYIEENVELRDLESTIDNIENLRLDKFSDKETNQLYQLHTNFLVTIKRNNGEEQVAVSVKSLSELERKTVIEKMEIERRYWKVKGVSFHVITEKEINKQFAENIKWAREAFIDKSVENKEELKEKLYYFLQKNKEKVIIDTLNKFDKDEELKAGTALFIFRYLVAVKEVEINMKEKLDLNDTINKRINF